MKTLMLRVARYFIAVAVALGFCAIAKAGVIVTYSTADLGGGLFQYNFTINNASGAIADSGLLIEGGNSVFGLGPSSTIGAPTGWSFISPLPPFDDLLSYFSLTPATNVPIGGSLSGFTFQSMTDPEALTEVDTIVVASDSSQMRVTITSEPTTVYIVGPILIAIGITTREKAKGRRARARAG
jgi:hypothetical protein